MASNATSSEATDPRIAQQIRPIRSAALQFCFKTIQTRDDPFAFKRHPQANQLLEPAQRVVCRLLYEAA